MHSFLITGGTSEKRKEKALELAKHHQISQFDTTIIEPSEESIGIEEIRSLKRKLSLKPFNSSQKIAILLNFELATLEAQNAFLKTLEEPPNNTLIVLASRNPDLLLPTIVSRCEIIQLTTSGYSLTTEELLTFNFQLSTLLSGGVGERLKLAQEVIQNQKNPLLWLEKMIIAAHQKLIDSPTQYLNFLTSLQKTHVFLSTTNVNPRLTLEVLFLNL